MSADDRASGNPERSRQHFRWDERHDQPHTDMSKWQKLWASRSDVASYLAVAASTLRHVRAVARAYRERLHLPRETVEVSPHHIGVAISPTVETFEPLIARVEELGVRALHIRVPCWQAEPVLGLHDRFRELVERGFRLTFALVPDRATVIDPACWAAYVRSTVAALADLEPTFQVGQAINRKKWGIWKPDEYLRLLDAVAAARAEHPHCRFTGPSVIDFEYYFTLHILAQRRPFDFDAIAALLYVDRRGAPGNVQYGYFDLERKIVLLDAVRAAAGHPAVPLHLSEFNWPLRGTGKHSPAGKDVQTSEERQAAFLVQYVLIALATGLVERVSWWQLVARGYGLCDDDTGWRRRPSFAALRDTVVPRKRDSSVPALFGAAEHRCDVGPGRRGVFASRRFPR
jgi:hypothetical protein